MPFAAAVPYITLALTVATTAYSIHQQGRAAKAEEALAARNAERIRMEAEEAAIRAEKDARRETSLARAKAAASGLGGLSSDLYLQDLQSTRQREIDWIRYSGMSQSNIEKMRGSYASQISDAKQISTLAAGVEKGFSIGEDAGWWTE